MNYEQKFEIALTLESNGFDARDIEDVLNAIYTNDYELLQTSLGPICDLLESLDLCIDAYDIKPIARFMNQL